MAFLGDLPPDVTDCGAWISGAVDLGPTGFFLGKRAGSNTRTGAEYTMSTTIHPVPAIGTLHTIGYADPEADAQLGQLLRNHDPIILLDIRHRPQSRWRPQWNRRALATRYGQQYHWEPRLGNLHYKEPALGIKLAPGHDEAIAWVVSLLRSGTSIILLCACKGAQHCHRSLVARLIQEALQVQPKGTRS